MPFTYPNSWLPLLSYAGDEKCLDKKYLAYADEKNQPPSYPCLAWRIVNKSGVNYKYFYVTLPMIESLAYRYSSLLESLSKLSWTRLDFSHLEWFVVCNPNGLEKVYNVSDEKYKPEVLTMKAVIDAYPALIRFTSTPYKRFLVLTSSDIECFKKYLLENLQAIKS